MVALVSRFFTPFLRWAYGVFAFIVVCYHATPVVLRSDWNKERLYRKLISADKPGKVDAAVDLIAYGGERQLLLALRSDSGGVREVAANALYDLWLKLADPQAMHLMELADKNVENNNYRTSLTALNLLTKNYPFFAEGWNRRALILSRLGFNDFAIADCKKAVLLNPNEFSAWQGMGICQLKVGDFEGAQRAFTEALKLVPHDAATLNYLKRCNDRLNQIRSRPAHPLGEEV
jgi:tetratricopeptide (TPR) repeat protein